MLQSTAQQQAKKYTAKIMISETDNINQFLDNQLLDLEQRFSQFMKEMEDDLIFPSFMVNEANAAWDDDDVLTTQITIDESNKPLLNLDKHTTVLCVTGSITVTVLVYLGMVLSS
jgi:hypothetical protein